MSRTIRLLETIHTLGLGAALAFSFLYWTRDIEVGGELMFASLAWSSAYFAKLAIEKHSKVAVHG